MVQMCDKRVYQPAQEKFNKCQKFLNFIAITSMFIALGIFILVCISVSVSAYSDDFTNFHAIPTVGDAPLNVSFIDDSMGTPTSWNWSFGDGFVSDEQNPYHIYLTPDTYDVNLTACNDDGCDIEEKLWYIGVNIPVEPTPSPTEEQTKINLISKGKNFIFWQWNRTGVNYTILDGEPKILNNGTYVYSNLLPNTTHILSISWDGINETISIVKTDSEYDYFKWFFIAMGLIMLIISLKIAVFSVVSSVIFITNLAYNYTLYAKMEIIICILLLIVSIILIDFNYGSK